MEDILNKIFNRLDQLTAEVQELKTNQVKMDTKMDHKIIKTLDLVQESQQDIIDSIYDVKPKVEDNQNFKGRVMTLERVASNHTDKLELHEHELKEHAKEIKELQVKIG